MLSTTTGGPKCFNCWHLLYLQLYVSVELHTA